MDGEVVDGQPRFHLFDLGFDVGREWPTVELAAVFEMQRTKRSVRAQCACVHARTNVQKIECEQ